MTDLDVISGKRQQLVGKIQERYGTAKEAAEHQADEFVKSLQIEQEEEKNETGRPELIGILDRTCNKNREITPKLRRRSVAEEEVALDRRLRMSRVILRLKKTQNWLTWKWFLLRG